MKYQLFDNVLSPEHIQQILEPLTCDHFPWYLQHKTVYNRPVDNVKYKEPKWFSHIFIRNDESVSNYSSAAMFVYKMFEQNTGYSGGKILRAQANLTTRDNLDLRCTPPHIDDTENEHMSMIYYVNNSDGPTILYNEDGSVLDTIEPVAGRVLLMDGTVLHSGSTPLQNDVRIVINYNLTFTCSL